MITYAERPLPESPTIIGVLPEVGSLIPVEIDGIPLAQPLEGDQQRSSLKQLSDHSRGILVESIRHSIQVSNENAMAENRMVKISTVERLAGLAILTATAIGEYYMVKNGIPASHTGDTGTIQLSLGTLGLGGGGSILLDGLRNRGASIRKRDEQIRKANRLDGFLGMVQK